MPNQHFRLSILHSYAAHSITSRFLIIHIGHAVKLMAVCECEWQMGNCKSKIETAKAGLKL